MSVVLNTSKLAAIASEPLVSHPLPRHPSLDKQKPARRSATDISSIPHSQSSDATKYSKKKPLIPLASKRSTVVFHTSDGREVDIPSNIAVDNLDWDTARHFTILTWGEKVVLGFIQAIRAFSQQWITHVLLVFVLLIYTTLGGVMFHYVEGSHEMKVKRNLDEARVRLSRKVWLSCKADDEAVWYKSFANDIKDYEQKIVAAPSAITSDVKWDFVGSLFFSGTVYTTIGYGNVVPCTDCGRCLTMVYAFIGIPLVLIVLADIGKMLTRAIKFVWSYIRLFYHTGKCKRLRSSHAVHAVHRLISKKRLKPASDSEVSSSEKVPEPKTFTVDDKFDLPVSIALFLLLGYIVLGALVIKEWENEWSYFHAFYFIFVSLTTIGFGDMVPNNATYLVLTFIYLLFGLALTSMCINVVQDSITNTALQAKRKIVIHMGLISRSSLRAKSIKTVSSIQPEDENKPK